MIVISLLLIGGPFDGGFCNFESDDPEDTLSEILEIGFPYTPAEPVISAELKFDLRFSTTYAASFKREAGELAAIAVYKMRPPASTSRRLDFIGMR